MTRAISRIGSGQSSSQAHVRGMTKAADDAGLDMVVSGKLADLHSFEWI